MPLNECRDIAKDESSRIVAACQIFQMNIFRRHCLKYRHVYLTLLLLMCSLTLLVSISFHRFLPMPAGLVYGPRNHLPAGLMNMSRRALTPTPRTHQPAALTYGPRNQSELEHTMYRAIFQTKGDIKRFRESLNSSTNILEFARRRHIINCSNVGEIKLGKYLGSGKFKTAYKGTFHGMAVVVKVLPVWRDRLMVDCARNIFLNAMETGTLDAIEEALYVTQCPDIISQNILHEILNHVILDYPMVVRNLGFCVRNITALANDTSILDRSVISVFEYGESVTVQSLKKTPWLERIRYGRDIAMLLELLDNSLIGSMVYGDVKLSHFVLVDGNIKLIDLDNYVNAVETICRTDDLLDPDRELRKRRPGRGHFTDRCKFGLPCENGLCRGEHALSNIESFNEKIYTLLFRKDTTPLHIYGHVRRFLDGVVGKRTNASEIWHFFNNILLANATYVVNKDR